MRTIPPLPVIIACVGLISACASPQHATSTPGTNPAVWTGAPAPAGAEAAEPAAGDLTLLQVRKDGSGTLVTTTDAFAMQDLLTGDKTAIIINAGAENPANITTGEPGKRLACGVIGAG